MVPAQTVHIETDSVKDNEKNLVHIDKVVQYHQYATTWLVQTGLQGFCIPTPIQVPISHLNGMAPMVPSCSGGF